MRELTYRYTSFSVYSLSVFHQITYKKAGQSKKGNKNTCSSSLDMCWDTNVRIAPVLDASSLLIALSFCTSNCSRVNRCAKRSFSPLCSREYVPATFFTRMSSAGKITCKHQQKNLIPQMFCASRWAYSWPINFHKYTNLWAFQKLIYL